MCSQLLFSLLLGCVFLQPTRDYFAFFSLSDNETGVKTKIILALKTPAGVDYTRDHQIEVFYPPDWRLVSSTDISCRDRTTIPTVTLQCFLSDGGGGVTVPLLDSTPSNFTLQLEYFYNPREVKGLYPGFTTIRLINQGNTEAVFGGAKQISNVLIPRQVEATLDKGPRTGQGELTVLTIKFTTANELNANSKFNVVLPQGMYTWIDNTDITVRHALATSPFVNSNADLSTSSFNFVLADPVAQNTLITIQVDNIANPLFKVQSKPFQIFTTSENNNKVDQNDRLTITPTGNCVLQNVEFVLYNRAASAITLFRVRALHSVAFTPQTGYMQFDLPNQIGILPDQVSQSSEEDKCIQLLPQASTNLICTVSDETEKIIQMDNSFIFQTDMFQDITGLHIQNPHQSGTLNQNIRISSRQKITGFVICDASVSPTFQSFSLNVARLTRASDLVSKGTELYFYLIPESDLFTTDTIWILLPNDQFGFQNSNSELTCQIQRDNGLFQSIDCVKQGFTSQPNPAQVQDTVLVISQLQTVCGVTGCLANKEIKLKINGKNAPWRKPVFQSTLRAFGLPIGITDINKAVAEIKIAQKLGLLIPQNFTQEEIKRSQNQVYSLTEYEVTFKLATWMPSGSVFRLSLPDYLLISGGNPQAIDLAPSLPKLLVVKDVKQYGTGYISVLTLDGFCGNKCQANTEMKFKLTGVQNARSARSSKGVLVIEGLTAQGYPINNGYPPIPGAPETGRFTGVDIEPETKKVGDIVKYKIQFVVTTAIPLGGRVEVEIPAQLKIMDLAACSITNSEYNCEVQGSVGKFIISSTNTEITGTVVLNTNEKMRNPQTMQPSSPFKITSYEVDGPDLYVIDAGVNPVDEPKLIVTMTTPGNLVADVERRPISTEMPKILQTDNQYHIHMKLANPIPKDGFIKIVIPKDQFNTIENVEPKLERIPATGTSVVMNSPNEYRIDRDTTSWNITLTICKATNACPQDLEIYIVVTQVQNPGTTRLPTSDIKIFTYTNTEGLIDYAATDAFPPLNAGPLFINEASRSDLTVSKKIEFKAKFIATTFIGSNQLPLIGFSFPPRFLYVGSGTLTCKVNGASSTCFQAIPEQDNSIEQYYYKNIRIIPNGDIQKDTEIEISVSDKPSNPYETLPYSLSDSFQINTYKRIIQQGQQEPILEPVNTGKYKAEKMKSLIPFVMQPPVVTRENSVATAEYVDAQISILVNFLMTVITPNDFIVEVGVPHSLFVLDVSAPLCFSISNNVNNPITCSISSVTATEVIVQISGSCPSLSVCSATQSLTYKIEGFRNIRYRPNNQRGKFSVLTKVSETSQIAQIKESEVNVNPLLINAIIPTQSIVPFFHNNKTGSSTELDLAFHLPSIAHSDDRLEIEGSQDLVIPSSSQSVQCFRINSQNEKAAVNCDVGRVRSVVQFCRGDKQCVRKKNYKLKLNPVLVKSLTSPLTGGLIIRFMTRNSELISEGSLQLSTLPSNFITPNIFKNFEIKTEPSNCNKVSQVCSRFIMEFDPTNDFASSGDDGGLLLTFPAVGSDSDGFSFMQGSSCITASTSIGAATVNSCTLDPDAETVLITHGINIGTNDLGRIKIVLSEVVLPPSTKPTVSFQIKSFKGQLQGVHYLYDQTKEGFTYTAKPGELRAVVATRGETTVGQKTKLTLDIVLAHRIPSQGKIIVTMPQNAQVEIIPNGQVTCVFEGNNQCQLTGTRGIEFTNPCPSGCSAQPTAYSLQIDNTAIKNKDFIKDPLTDADGLHVQTMTQEGYGIDSSLPGLTVTPRLTPGQITFVNLTRSSNIVGEITSYIFTVRLTHLPIPRDPDGKLFIQMAEDIIFKPPQDIQCKLVQALGGYDFNCQVNLLHVGSTSISLIQASIPCGITPQVCQYNATLSFNVSQVLNPPSSAISKEVIQVTTATSEGYRIDVATSPAISSLLPPLFSKTFEDLSVQAVEPFVSTSTDYNFIFTADTLIPKTAKVSVTFPPDVSLPRQNACTDLFVETNDQVACTVDPTSRVVLVSGLFPDDANFGQFGFQLQGIMNPNQEGRTSPFPVALVYNEGSITSQDALGPLISSDSIICEAPCKSCQSKPTSCTQCFLHSDLPLLKENTCQAQCGDGYFFNTYDKKCYPCHHSCLKCYDHRSDSCVLCSSKLIFNDGFCINSENCPPSTIPSTSPDSNVYYCKNKASCKAPCKACSLDRSFCMECDRSSLLSTVDIKQGTCVQPQNCSSGFWAASSDVLCDTCRQPCLDCQGAPSACTKCNSVFRQNIINPESKVCRQACEKGEYAYFDPFIQENQCRLCNPICSECTGRLPNECVSCNQNIDGLATLYLLGSQCVLECPSTHNYNTKSKVCQEFPKSPRSFALWFLLIESIIAAILVIIAYCLEPHQFAPVQTLYALVSFIQASNRILLVGNIWVLALAVQFTLNLTNFFMAIVMAIIFNAAHFYHMVATSKRYHNAYKRYSCPLKTLNFFSFLCGPPMYLLLSSWFLRVPAFSNHLRRNAYFMSPLMRYLWLFLVFCGCQITVCIVLLIKVQYPREAFVCACFGLIFNTLMFIFQLVLLRKQYRKSWFYYKPQKN